MRDFTQLEVWKRAVEFALLTRRLVRSFPRSERFELSRQLVRAADSVAANIAEGSARGTDGDFERHLRIAAGSAAEVHTFLTIARSAGYGAELDAAIDHLESTRRMINALVSKVRDDRRRA